MHFPSGLRALNHRDFRLFWTGQLISLAGSWMQSVGQDWLVLELTNSPLKLGLISTLQFAPMMLFSLFAGAVVDRLPKRRLIIGMQVSLMLLAFILSLLVWTGHIRYWQVAVLATILGVVNTLDMPGRQAFIVEMVGKEDLMNGIALNSALFNVARIIGPAAAGLLVARYGVAPAFFLNGASFVAVIIALLFIRAEGLPRPRTGATVGQEIGEGLVYAIRNTRIAFILGLLMAVSIFVLNYNVLVPVLAKAVLHQAAQGFGLLMSALGAGALAGALTLAVAGRSEPALKTLVVSASVVCAGSIYMGTIHQMGLAAAVLFVMGFAQILFSASCNTLLQVMAPDRLRGRVMSLYTLVFAGVTPIGSFFAGAIAEGFGAPMGFLAGGLLGLACVAGLTTWWMHRRHAGAHPAES